MSDTHGQGTKNNVTSEPTNQTKPQELPGVAGAALPMPGATPESAVAHASSAPRPSLKKKAMHGAAWTVGGHGARMVLRLGSNLVLTRLLFPEAFGLMALVHLFRRGLEMFSDIGTGPAVMQHPRAEEKIFQDTAWSIQVVRGFALWLICCALAIPVAMLYDEPILTYLLPITGITAVVLGFTPTKVIIAQRSLKLKEVTLTQVISQFIGVSVMVVWAYLYPSVWALAWGTVVGIVVQVALMSYFVPGGGNKLRWERSSARDLFSFGKWIFLATAVFFVADQLDRALIAAYLGMGMLGVYSIGFTLAEAPRVINQQLIRRVLYPALVQVKRERPEDVSSAFYKARKSLDWLFLPMLGLISGGGGTIVVMLLYDYRYYEAGWIFQALSMKAAFRCVLEPAETCLVALGFPRYATLQQVIRLIWIVSALPLGWYWFGALGLVIPVALAELVVLPVLWIGLRRQKVLRPLAEVRSLLILAGSMIPGFIAMSHYLSEWMVP